MALGKRATAPATKAPAVAAAPEADDNVITSITVARGMTVSMGEYNSLKAQVTVSGNDYETVSAKVEELLGLELEKAGAQFNAVVGQEAGDDDTGEEAEGEADEDGGEGEAEDAEDGEEAGLTAEDVNAMKRPELEKLIEENELEIDPKDHPKTVKGLASLRAAIIEVAFSEDEDGEDAEAEEAEEEEITEEAINAMDRPGLIKFIKANEIDVDPTKHTKLSGLKAAVIEALSDGEEEAEEGEEAEEEAVEYDEAGLKAMGVDDLKAIYSDWGMGAFPKGPPAKAKGLAIKAILAAQEG